MSYSRKLLYAIADEMKRPHSDFEKYISDLESNWYDTKESLQKINDNQLFRLGFPGRLVQLIRERVGSTQAPQQQQFQQQPYQQPQNYSQNAQTYNQPTTHNQPSTQNQQFQQPSRNNQMGPQQAQSRQPPTQSTQQKQNTQVQNSQPSQIEQLLTSMRKRLNNETEFLELTDVLKKIFFNIQHNLQQQKYRSIKKGNLLSRLVKNEEIAHILRIGGFEDGQNQMVMRQLDLNRLNIVCDQIERNSRPKFDPYQAQISSITGLMADMGNEGVSIWGERLDQLNKQRERLMSIPIKNRQIRICKYKSEASRQKVMEKDTEDAPNQDEKIFIQNIKQNIKKLQEGTNFSCKRKAEYLALSKVPCFSQTLARVQLPNNIIFECRFSPSEKLSKLVEIFEEHMVNKNIPYYLYMSPPVQKIEKKIKGQTFYELGCVPAALFYFGSDDPNVLKMDILKTQSVNYRTYE